MQCIRRHDLTPHTRIDILRLAWLNVHSALWAGLQGNIGAYLDSLLSGVSV